MFWDCIAMRLSSVFVLSSILLLMEIWIADGLMIGWCSGILVEDREGVVLDLSVAVGLVGVFAGGVVVFCLFLGGVGTILEVSL